MLVNRSCRIVVLTLLAVTAGFWAGCRNEDKSQEEAIATKLSEFQIAYEHAELREVPRVLDDALAFIDAQTPNNRTKAALMFARVVGHGRKAIVCEKFLLQPETAASEKKAAIIAIRAAIAEGVFPLQVSSQAGDEELFKAAVDYINALDTTTQTKWQAAKVGA